MVSSLRIIVTVFGMTLLIAHTIAQQEHWNNPNNDQFHIQTDEGNERYFRYQTYNGQYRKEKRLKDGTIVGSYGWIDGDGMLRLQDYIADDAGYRILRTKDVFVGRNRPISQAIQVAKNSPANGGELLKNTKQEYFQSARGYVASTTESPLNNEISAISDNSLIGSSTPLPPIYPSSYSSTSPSPTSILSSPITDYINIPSSSRYIDLYPSSTPATDNSLIVSSTPLPPIYPSSYSSNNPPPTSIFSSPTTDYINIPSSSRYIDLYPSSTPATVIISPRSPLNYLRTNPSRIIYPTPIPTYYPTTPSNPTEVPPSINSNSLLDSDQHYRFQNGPTYPITKFGTSYTGGNVGVGDDHGYNGVSVTNDGFRYYIPRAYHEEERIDGVGSKAGSFGYIDPFGIRRVVYYNAGLDGFKHRKNNRYVGFDATPYDPRPY